MTARDRLIDAGVQALAGLGAVGVLRAVGTREIARRAGVSSSTFFHHFTSLDDFADAVVDRLYDPGWFPDRERSGELLDSVGDESFPLTAALAFHDFEIRKLRTDPLFRVRLGLWALAGEQLDQIYGAFLAELEERQHARAAAVYAAWGREVRPPLDVAGLAAATVAFLQGATIRWIVTPQTLDPARYARLAATLTAGALRPFNDPRDLDDALTEINWYPAGRTRGRRAARSGATEKIVRAAETRFAADGYEGTSVGSIAREAGVHVDTLYAHFTSKRHLAVVVFADEVAASAPGPRPEPWRDRVQAHLVAVATAAYGVPDLADQALIAATERTATSEFEAFTGPLRAALADAVEDHQIRPGTDEAVLARLLLTATLLSRRAQPSTPSEAVVAEVLDTVLVGFLAG